jgi:hypothetical protein
METPTVRPKPDRRTQPRIPPPDIADRAYTLYQRRGGEHGHDVDDWLQAERELREATRVPSRDAEREGMLLYVVTTAPGADPHSLPTAEQAVARALACAKRQHARAWFKSDNDCVLLEDFREVTRFRLDVL